MLGEVEVGRQSLLWVALAFWSLTLVACALLPSEPPTHGPDIVGTITEVRAGRAYPAILIEDKMWLTVTGQTSIFVERADGSLHGGAEEDLKVGVLARAWHGDVVLDSYPQQASATHIVIIESAGP